MEDKRKLELLAELFELSHDELTPSTVLSELDNWDSMTKLSLIVLFADECNKKLNGETIRQFKTIKDIMNHME